MVPVKEILNYTPEQWRTNQKQIVERVVSGREYLGLEEEWVADKPATLLLHSAVWRMANAFLSWTISCVSCGILPASGVAAAAL